MTSLGSLTALIVHNEDAGTDPTPRNAIERLFTDIGIQTVYCAHGNEDLDQALKGSFDFIVAAGGDGTIADVVSALIDVDVPIGILPLGGSNNIANAIGVDLPWEMLPAQWSLDRWTRLDRCEADGPWGKRTFLEAVGSGVLTDAVDAVDDDPDTPEEKRANGRAAFRKALDRAQAFDCEIMTDAWHWKGKCLMVEVMNIQFVGSRLALANGAVGDDGLLDVVLVTQEDREPLLAWAADPDAAPCPIETRRAQSVRLTVKDRAFRVDDRCPNENLSGTVDIAVRQTWVKVLLPDEKQR